MLMVIVACWDLSSVVTLEAFGGMLAITSSQKESAAKTRSMERQGTFFSPAWKDLR